MRLPTLCKVLVARGQFLRTSTISLIFLRRTAVTSTAIYCILIYEERDLMFNSVLPAGRTDRGTNTLTNSQASAVLKDEKLVREETYPMENPMDGSSKGKEGLKERKRERGTLIFAVMLILEKQRWAENPLEAGRRRMTTPRHRGTRWRKPRQKHCRRHRQRHRKIHRKNQRRRYCR